MQGFVKVKKVGEMSPGDMTLVEVEGERILLANVGGKLHAVDEACPHREAPLSGGVLEGEEVDCPLHGSRFNVTTGECLVGPSTRGLQQYAVKVEGEDIFIGPA